MTDHSSPNATNNNNSNLNGPNSSIGSSASIKTLTTGHLHKHNHDKNNRKQSQDQQQTGPEEEFTIRVLTLNCWGLWLGAKKRRQRMAGIVRYLRENNCDIVFLQEVWVTSDFEIIKNGTKDMYRFAHLFRSGSVLGSSGIVILCRWLPRVVHFEPYSLNGSPFYPWHGDWFAGKGIAYSRVDFDGLSLHLFSTHTHAYYKEDEPVNDQYSVHRICQSFQLARFITFIRDTACNRKVHGKDLMIVAGDMNSTSSELPYKILTTMAGLTDCFKASRYNNPSSNIIHKHKLLNYRRKFKDSNEDVSASCDSDNNSGVGFLRNKFADNSLLETIELYKNRIAQVFFDSDTDDEDITYCHPRNSFTPSVFNYAKQKFANKSSMSSSQPEATASSSSTTSRQHSNGKSGDTLDMKNSADNRSTAKQSIIMDDISISSCGAGSVSNAAAAVAANQAKRTRKSPMKRIDFILCSLLTHGHCVVDKIDSESKDPSLDCSLSDHEPVMVELKICDNSHDLIEKNRIDSEQYDAVKKRKASTEHSRPLASVVEPKGTSSHLEETTNQWVSEKDSIELSYQECNIQVMEETQDLLNQYYQYNRAAKTQLFYVVLLMFIVTLPVTTYYALSNELIPLSTVVFMWVAASFLFSLGLLIGFLCYRYEQGAIEAILNDITCKIAVARRFDEKNNKADRFRSSIMSSL